MRTIDTLAPADRTFIRQAAANCVLFERIEELAKDGKLDEILACLESGYKMNFESILLVCKHAKVDPRPVMGEALDDLEQV